MKNAKHFWKNFQKIFFPQEFIKNVFHVLPNGVQAVIVVLLLKLIVNFTLFNIYLLTDAFHDFILYSSDLINFDINPSGNCYNNCNSN